MEFEKEFVRCMYDEELVGKTCIFADDLPSLREHVATCDNDYIDTLAAPSISGDESMDDMRFPFYTTKANECYRFVYYDPNLECKMAFEQGKQIQYYDSGEWFDVPVPTWKPDIEYRVKSDVSENKYIPYNSVSEMLCDEYNVDNVEDIKNCIWVRLKENTSIRYMIIGMDLDMVLIDGVWTKLPELFEKFLWDDFTVIGK